MDGLLNIPVEVLNPYKFLVAVFTREYIRLRRDLAPESLTIKLSPAWREKEREDCKNYLLVKWNLKPEDLTVSGREAFDTLRFFQHIMRSPERDFADLIDLVYPVMKRAHFLLFQRIVEMLRRDDLEEMSKYVETNFGQVLPLLKVETTVGALFMKNVRLLFEEMSYTACDRFSAHLLDYIEAGFYKMETQTGEPHQPNQKPPDDKRASTAVTASQTQYTLSKEANLLVRNPCLAGDPQLSRIFNAKPSLENANYVRFLDCIRSKNYGQAMDSLHKYYTLKDPFDEKSIENGGSFKPGEANLHLCIMHHNAGHHQLAVQSLRECIFLAQQKGDVQLLTHAMYWLASLEINNNQYEKLYRGASGGDFIRFPEISAQFASLISRFDACFGAEVTKVTGDLDFVELTDDSLNRVALLQQYASRATFWNLYGFDEIGAVYAQGCLQIFSKPEGGKFSIATDSVALSASILWYQAVRLRDEVLLKIISEYCRKMFPVNKFNDWHVWGLSELFWKYQQAFNRLDYDTAETIVEHMAKINPAEASLRKAELLLHKDFRPKLALDLLNTMLKSCAQASAHVEHLVTTSSKLQLRVLLMKCDVLLHCKCSLEALKCIMEALAVAVEHPNALWKAKVEMQLGYVWLQLEEPSQAKACLESCFPILSGCGFKADEAKVWLLKGKLLLVDKASLGHSECEDSVLVCFERALEAFSFCDNVVYMLYCLYMLAVIHGQAPDVARRDIFSKLFMDLSAQHPHASISAVV